MFVGLGQVLGRAFDAYPNRVMGYTLNIGGSLVGIAGIFADFASFRRRRRSGSSISCAGIAYLLHQVGGIDRGRAC